MCERRPVDAVILVGGKGTRLQGIVRDRPKPMAEVCGRPFLEWLLLALQLQGVRRVILATGHMAETIEVHFRNPGPLAMELVFSRERAPLGTGGALRNALDKISTQRVLVLNGDSTCPFDLDLLMERHLRSKALATLWLVPVEDCSRYGSVEVDADGRVTAFREKTPSPRPGLISAGVYLLERSALEGIPPHRPVSLETEVFPSLVGTGLYASTGRGPFLDIGTPESYAAAARFLAANAPDFSLSRPEDRTLCEAGVDGRPWP